MYELEKENIKHDLYNILVKNNDKHIIVKEILEYIENNINILWDVVKNDKR